MPIATPSLLASTRTQLLTGSPIYGNRVYAELAPANTTMPYVVMSIVSAISNTLTQREDRVEILIQIKCISNTIADAITGALDIDERVNQQGSQNYNGGALVGDSTWGITTIFPDIEIKLTEYVDNKPTVHHVGKQYRCQLDTINEVR